MSLGRALEGPCRLFPPSISIRRGVWAKRLLQETLGGIRCLEHIRCVWEMNESLLSSASTSQGTGEPGLTGRAVWKYSPGIRGPPLPMGLSWDGPGDGTGNTPAEQGASQQGPDRINGIKTAMGGAGCCPSTQGQEQSTAR